MHIFVLQIACQTIAVVLHYAYLVTFMWMLMEGVVLYVALVRVFVTKPHRYIIGFTVVSYGKLKFKKRTKGDAFFIDLFFRSTNGVYGISSSTWIFTSTWATLWRGNVCIYNAHFMAEMKQVLIFSYSCWLRYDTHFVWAFISPVVLIIIVSVLHEYI